MNPPSDSTSIPPLPATSPQNSSLGGMVDTLLKRPATLISFLCQAADPRSWLLFAMMAAISFALYGVVVGAFSGGIQMYAALVKVSGGALLSAGICFPSLYIFACLTGADVSLRGLAGVLFAMLTLTGLLLLGFAPIAWVFSQSTDSVAFIGTLHLAIWAIATLFGIRLLKFVPHGSGRGESTHFRVWTVIFVLVSLQMTTALRPIVGTAPHWLPGEKKFFLAHWADNLFRNSPPTVPE